MVLCYRRRQVTTGMVPGNFLLYHAPIANATTMAITTGTDQCICFLLCYLTDDVARLVQYARPQIDDNEDKTEEQKP